MRAVARAVVFDLDGTLVDSAPDIAGALNRALDARGFPVLPVGDVIAMVGHGARSLCERALKVHGDGAGRASLDALHARFLMEYEAVPFRETRLYPGVRSCLDGLAADGWQLAVCTNKPQRLADLIVAGLLPGVAFAAVIGGRNGVPLKPSGTMVLDALVACGMSSAADGTYPIRRRLPAVMVGDSKADLEAGRAAGLAVILLRQGYSSLPLDELGADAVLDGFEGLADRAAALVAGAGAG